MGANTINLSDTVAQWLQKSNNLDSDFGTRTTLSTINKSSLVAAINEVNDLLNKTDSADVINLINSQALGVLKLTDSAQTIALINSTVNFGSLLDSDRLKSMIGLHATTSGKFSDTSTINFDSSGPRMTLQDSCITAKNFKECTTIVIQDAAGSVLTRLFSPDSAGG